MIDRAGSFIELARRDLAAAKLLRTTDPGNAAFHLQQASEKLTKAVLSIERIPVALTHQIGALAAMLPDDHPLRADLAAFDRFSSFGTSKRYPLPGGGLPQLPSANLLAEGIADVESLIEEIDGFRRERTITPRRE